MVMSMNGASLANGATTTNGHRLNNGSPNGNHNNSSNLPKGEAWDLHRVLETVREDDEGKWDKVVFRDQLTLLNGKLLIPESASSNEVEELTPTPWATSQMCGRLGIPTAYFRRCPLDLQDAQFNVWARHHDRFEANGFESNGFDKPGISSSRTSSTRCSANERWLLRARHDSLRGVLSDRYTRLDNEPFLNILQPLVPERLQVKWFALSDESLHLRLIDPTLSREVLPDDRLSVGLHVANSETGRRSVTIDAIVWRLVCQNGLVRLVKGKSLLQQRHIFISQSNFKRDLERAMGEALTTSAGLLERMQQSTTEHLDDVETLIEKIGERHQLSEAFQEKIKNALLLENRGQQETLYGLTNALTQAAQTLPPDDRYGMEVMAGEVMERGAIWLNDLPKAKAKRKTDAKPMNGSPFVSAASVIPSSVAHPASTRTESDGFGPARQDEAGHVENCRAEQKAVVQVAAPAVSSTVNTARIENLKVTEVNGGASSPAQKETLRLLAQKRGLGTYDLHHLVVQEFDKGALDELTRKEADQFIVLLQQRRREELLAPVPEYDEDDEPIEEDE